MPGGFTQKKRKINMKKIISIFTALAISLLCLPVSYAGANGGISVLGADTETKGNWVNTYGKSGYTIFYGDTVETSGRDGTAKHIEKMPEYASAKNTTAGFSYGVFENPSEDERALLMPTEDGYVKRAITTYNYNKNAFNVKINDETAHIVSFYVTSFGDEYNKIYYRVTDRDGNLIEKKDFDYSEGTYISVFADCEFNFEIGEYDEGATLGVNAIFFDEPTENGAQNFTAFAAETARSVKLEWNSKKTVNIYRKSESETAYALIAEKISDNGYTDTGLDTGTAYSYLLRETGSLYSKALYAECSLEEYNKINLSVESTESISFENWGDTAKILLRAENEQGDCVENIKISAVLDGDFSYLTDEEKIIAAAVTDKNGEAELEITAEYYGDYKIKLISEYDDEREYKRGEACVNVSLTAGEHKAEPYISKISEEISPGEIFNIYGEGIKGENIEIEAKKDGEEPILLEALQTDMSEYGYYVTTKLPENASEGVYDIRVKNDYGQSKAIKLNGAVALFIDEYEIYPGLDVRVVGRNFDGSKFGLSDNPQVRLVNENGTAYSARILEANRVMLRFTVGDNIPSGEYTVWVNNSDGGNWAKLQSGQTLTVLAEHTDPLGIGVPWTNKFCWTEYPASDFGIMPDTGEDLSAKINDATQKIEKQGGGVLLFGEGEYKMSFISLRSSVVICGTGKDKTTFKRISGEDNRFMMRTSDSGRKNGLFGIANLKICADSDDNVPTQSWIMPDGNNKSCSNIFIFNTDLKLAEDCGEYTDAVAVLGLTERLIIKNCNMDGIPTNGYIRRYGKYLNNSFNYTETTPALFAEYSSIVGNSVINPQVAAGNINTSQTIHGFSIKGNTYYAENETVLGLHPDRKGAGEVVMLEPPSTMYACGRVINAEDNRVRIHGHEHMVTDGEIVLPTPTYGELYITIAGGRGMGQYRKIVSSSGRDTLILDKAWDIVPDASSTYTIMVAFENTTIYNNTAAECEASIAFYSNCFNCVALENKLDTTGGITVNAFHLESQERVAPVYHIRIEDNVLTNHIDPDNWKGLSATGQRGGDDVQLIGIEYKNNKISNSENHPLYQGEVGTRIRLTGSSVGYDYNALGIILDSNTYIGFDTPVILENVSGVVLNENKFEDCGTTFITENGSLNTLYSGKNAGQVYFADGQTMTDNAYHKENLINESGEAVGGKLIIAVYDSEMRLKQAVIKDATVLNNSRLAEDILLNDEEALSLDDGDVVKTFFFRDLDALYPLAFSKELTVENHFEQIAD